MDDLSPVKWVQQVTKNCLEYISYGNNENRMTDALILKKVFESYKLNEQQMVYKLLREQFETQDSILILSYIINILKINEVTEVTAKQIYVGEFDCFTSIMLEIQVLLMKDVDFRLRRKIHRKNIQILENELKLNYTYIPIEKREKKRIVIITEQLLDNYHAPTLMVLELVYVLQKYFHYEILIFTCTSNAILQPTAWVCVRGFNSSGCGYQQWKYKEENISVCQYPLQSCTINDYHDMMQKIYDFNPVYVLNMGVNSPIADLPRLFTTVVVRNMSTQPPVSEADIVVRSKEYVAGNEDEGIFGAYQKQIFMGKKFPVIVNTSNHVFTREELNLPENKFLVCIVGNRLDKEIDDNFMHYMFSILSQNMDIDFVIIGEAENILSKIEQTLYRKRVHFLGFCKDLLGVYRVLDLYLNPKRTGGGWSSAIALQAGLPIVTLPDCDVAYNVSGNFVVQDEYSMFETVLHYAVDKEYYEEQVGIAKKCCAKNSEEQTIEYATELLTRIKEALPDD